MSSITELAPVASGAEPIQNPAPENIWLEIGQRVTYSLDGIEIRNGTITDILPKGAAVLTADSPRIPYIERNRVIFIIDLKIEVPGEKMLWIQKEKSMDPHTVIDADKYSPIFPDLQIGDVVMVTKGIGHRTNKPQVVTGLKHKIKGRMNFVPFDDLTSGWIMVQINYHTWMDGREVTPWWRDMMSTGDTIQYWEQITEPSFEPGAIVEHKGKDWVIDKIGAIVWSEPLGSQMITSRSIPRVFKDDFLFYTRYGTYPINGTEIRDISGPFLFRSDVVGFITNDGEVRYGTALQLRNILKSIIKGLEKDMAFEDMDKLPWDYVRGSNHVLVMILTESGHYELVPGKDVFPYSKDDEKGGAMAEIPPPDIPPGPDMFIPTDIPLPEEIPEQEEIPSLVDELPPIDEELPPIDEYVPEQELEIEPEYIEEIPPEEIPPIPKKKRKMIEIEAQ